MFLWFLKKVLGEKLTMAENLMSTLKLAAAVGIKYTQDKKWLPTDPFNKK